MSGGAAPRKKPTGSPRTYREGVQDTRLLILDFLETEYMKPTTERGSRYGQEILDLTRKLCDKLNTLR